MISLDNNTFSLAAKTDVIIRLQDTISKQFYIQLLEENNKTVTLSGRFKVNSTSNYVEQISTLFDIGVVDTIFFDCFVSNEYVQQYVDLILYWHKQGVKCYVVDHHFPPSHIDLLGKHYYLFKTNNSIELFPVNRLANRKANIAANL